MMIPAMAGIIRDVQVGFFFGAGNEAGVDEDGFVGVGGHVEEVAEEGGDALVGAGGFEHVAEIAEGLDCMIDQVLAVVWGIMTG